MNNIPTCHGCQDERNRRETKGIITPAQFQRIVQLLQAGVRATVAKNCDELVLEEAVKERLRAQIAEAYEDEVVAQVQQRLHDEFIDTTRPACPEHPNHPLWFADGWWRCEQSGTRIAELGQLPRRR